MAKMAELFRRYIWNRRIAWALFLVSPALLGSVAGRLIEHTTGKALNAAAKHEKTLEKQAGELDRLTTALVARQQARAAELLRLNAIHTEVSAKLMTDRLARLNAQGDLRRIAALLWPADWKDRTAPADAILNTEYTVDKVAVLQDFENVTMQAASAAMVRLQSALNQSSTEKEQLEERSKWLRWLAEITGLLLTVILFFVKENTGSKAAPSSRRHYRRPWRTTRLRG